MARLPQRKTALTAALAKKRLKGHANRQKALFLQRFFKTGPGEYAAGDVFIGVTVPKTRLVAKEFRELPSNELFKLLQSKIHEERLLALLIWTEQYRKADDATKKTIYQNYIRKRRFINNWDLVDLSAHKIVGHYLEKRSKQPLYALARSRSLWDRRIAIMATFHNIRVDSFDTTLKIATQVLRDPEDLIHKAVGWMLREIGKRSLRAEEQFLKKHYKTMPRTMLRYAIEKFPEKKRKAYLLGQV